MFESAIVFTAMCFVGFVCILAVWQLISNDEEEE